MAVGGETVGQAFVRIRADTSGVGDDIRRDLEGQDLDRAGERAGRDFGDGFTRGAKKNAKPEDLFGPDFRRRVKSSLKDIDPVLDDFGKNIRSRMRNSLADTDPFHDLGSRMRRDLHSVDSVADEFTRNLSSRLRGGLNDLDPFNTRLSAIHQGFARIRSDADSMARITDAINDARAASERFEDHGLAPTMDRATRSSVGLDRELRRKPGDINEVGRSSRTLTKELERLKNAFSGTGGAAGRSHSQISAIITAIALLGPAIGPLVGAASAALIGLGADAGVAALGILGIRDAMKAGTDLGDKYKEMFVGVRAEWNDMKGIAAAGLFQGISDGIAAATKVFPAFNAQLSGLSQTMGLIVGNVGAGLINLFVQLFPLIQSFTNSLANGSKNFLSWSQNSSSFSNFLAFAQAELPKILDLLASFSEALLTIIKVMSPFGDIIVSALKGLFDAITWLGTVAPGLLATFFAVFAVSRLTGIVSAITGIALAIARLGVVMRTLLLASVAGAALTVLFLAIQHFSGANQRLEDLTQKSKTAIEGLNDALKESGGAVDQSVLSKALDVGQLPQVNAILKQTGISVSQFAQALTGTGQQWNDFRNLVVDTLDEMGIKSGPAVSLVLSVLDDTRKAFLKGKASAEEYAKAQKALVDAMIAANPEIAEQARLLGVSAPAMLAAATAAEKQAKQQRDATLAMQAENDAAGLLKQSLDALNGKSLSAAEANTAFHTSMLSMVKALKDGKNAGIGFTEKGLATRSAIEGQIDSAKTAAQAVADLTGSTNKGAAAYKTYGQSILDQIAKVRGLKTEQQKANDKVFQYAKNLIDASKLKVKPTVLEVETKAAGKNVANLQTLINKIKQGKVPGINANSDRGRAVIKDIQNKIDGIKQHQKAVIDADITRARAKAEQAQAAINRIIQHGLPKVDLNTKAGMDKLTAVEDKLRNISGMAVTAYVDILVRTHPEALPRNAGAIRAALDAKSGAIVSTPSVYNVGEMGKREAIVPLELPLNQVNPEVRGMAALLRGQSPKGMQNGGIIGGGKTINATINVTPQAADPEAVSWSVLNRLTVLGR